ncbi:MAG: hypothetical protein ACR2GZ_10825 [Solirubrobacteraceae bacterium]
MNCRDDLWRELTAVGITGTRRARIVAEIEDHLACDPSADLGAPAALAAQFADELGTGRALRAARWTFGALALAGLLFGAAFVGSPSAAFGAAPAGAPLLGGVARVVAILAPQVAFVAGLLAALRALRRRRAAVIPSAEASVIVRRAWVGLAFGLATMVSLGVLALEFHRQVSSAWYTYALIAASVGVAALLGTLPSLVAAGRLRPVSDGDPGDIFVDLGAWAPGRLRGHPWWLAVLSAAGVALAITVAGGGADDLYDGAARGLADALVCLLGFATLGRYLGLWRPAPAG